MLLLVVQAPHVVNHFISASSLLTFYLPPCPSASLSPPFPSPPSFSSPPLSHHLGEQQSEYLDSIYYSHWSVTSFKALRVVKVLLINLALRCCQFFRVDKTSTQISILRRVHGASAKSEGGGNRGKMDPQGTWAWGFWLFTQPISTLKEP